MHDTVGCKTSTIRAQARAAGRMEHGTLLRQVLALARDAAVAPLTAPASLVSPSVGTAVESGRAEPGGRGQRGVKKRW
jgi:hypothetical protein